jgi:hypothetical protein
MSKKLKGQYAAYITLNGRIIKKIELTKSKLNELVNGS